MSSKRGIIDRSDLSEIDDRKNKLTKGSESIHKIIGDDTSTIQGIDESLEITAGQFKLFLLSDLSDQSIRHKFRKILVSVVINKREKQASVIRLSKA